MLFTVFWKMIRSGLFSFFLFQYQKRTARCDGHGRKQRTGSGRCCRNILFWIFLVIRFRIRLRCFLWQVRFFFWRDRINGFLWNLCLTDKIDPIDLFTSIFSDDRNDRGRFAVDQRYRLYANFCLGTYRFCIDPDLSAAVLWQRDLLLRGAIFQRHRDDRTVTELIMQGEVKSLFPL